MSRENELQELILTHNRRLQKLQERMAVEGISVDPKVPIEIEDIQMGLEKLQSELKEIEQNKLVSEQANTSKLSTSKIHSQQLSSLRDYAKEIIEAKKREASLARDDFDFGESRGYEEIGPSKIGTMGLVKYFQNGMVVWHDFGEYARKAFVVYGGIGDRYKKLGEDRWRILGFPTTNEENAAPSPFGNTGRFNLFEDGVIVWCDGGRFRDQSYALWGSISSKYNALDGTGSYLGFPTSEIYSTKNGQRCDFEGGAIVHLNGDEDAVAVRQLLRLDYSDSPFNHEWRQYDGPNDPECISVRFGTGIGRDKNYIAFNFSWENRAVNYPIKGFAPDEFIEERYCGVTVKSLSPGQWIRFYLKVQTKPSLVQYLEFDSENRTKKFIEDEKEQVEYWNVPLPSECNDSEWHTFIIDLNHHVQEGFRKPYKSFGRFNIRGAICVADLIASDSCEALEEVAINPIRLQ